MEINPEISLVIPVMSEEGSLQELHRQLTDVLAEIGRSYEIIFVNDGSTDNSARILDELADQDCHVGVIHFRHNFGKAAAIDAGFKTARGEIVFTMDADLQDEPKEIPRFLEKLAEGYDLVNGWKKIRHDPLHKTLPSRLFNSIVCRTSGLKLKDINCGFKAYKKEVLEGLNLYGELHRFIPVLVFSRGYKITEISVTHHPRRFDKSKYGVERLAKGFFDLLTVLLTTRYISRPLHLFGLAGLVIGLFGMLALSYLTVLWFAGNRPIGNRPLLFLGLLLVMVGVQLVSTGLLGELITRTQHHGQLHYEIHKIRHPAAKY